MMKLGLVAALVLSLSAAACAPRASLDAPPGFARLDRSNDFDFRATSARGVVVAVRSEENDLRANVDFWADSIDLRLRREGYDAKAAKDVVTPEGLKGKQLRYVRAEGGRTYCYWLTVFANEKRVYVVEAGGDEESFDPATAEVERSVLSLRAR